MDRPRLVLADDHLEFLDCTKGLLDSEFEIVETVTDGQALLEAADRVNPDVLVLDISMPGLSGLEVARQLKAAGSPVKIIFLTVHEDDDFVRAALDAGAEGYVIKHRLASDLVPAVRAVLAGRQFVSDL